MDTLGVILAAILCVFVGILIIGGLLAFVLNGEDKSKPLNPSDQINPIDRIEVGIYIGGLPNCDKQVSVECLITEQDFVFSSGVSKTKELSRIPRDSINQIILDDPVHTMQRMTMVHLGFASLIKPKDKDLYLLIDWDDESGQTQNTLFQYDPGLGNATKTVMKLRKYMKRKVQRLTPEEKKCPYCAEVIKKEAIICRFCRSNL